MTEDPPFDEGLPQSDDVSAAKVEPAPPPPPPPQNGNGIHAETINERVLNAREVIPVGDRGVTPQTYAQWVDVAKDVCRAHLMLPQHLHNNASVVAGLLEIAARFRLSVYMLASKTYVQNNRLCFEAQAFGAIMYASGLLRGRLRFEFHGEGLDRTCTVHGRFKDDPDTIYSATTPTIAQLHPGYSSKEGKQTMVRGSPLWDKDPEQQLAYYAERRWIRRHAPDACMGMYTPDEIAEIDQYRVGRDGAIPLTVDRLGQLDTGEGWSDGSRLDTDLAAIEPERESDYFSDDPEPDPDPPRPAARKAAHPPARKPVQAKKPLARTKVGPASKNRTSKPPARRGTPPSRAEVRAAADRAQSKPRVVSAPVPKWLDYVGRVEVWIRAAESQEQADAAMSRWEGEREVRDQLQVPMGERSRLRAILDRKVAMFSPRKPKEEDAA